MKLTNLFLIVLVIIYVFYKQMQPRKIRQKNTSLIVITLLGVYTLLKSIDQHHFQLTAANVGLLAGSLILLAVGCGIWRAFTCKIWQEDKQYFRQATIWTMIIWVITIFLHGMMAHFFPVLEQTTLLYIALSLLSQRLILQWRSQRI